MFKIKTYNAISVKGLDRFGRENYEVASEMPHADAILLRSQKLHDEEISESVVAVARAGAGVNNIPVEDYTKKGVVVFNAPGANANAVKELVLVALLLSSRGIVQGMKYVNTLDSISDAGEMSKLLEKEKKRFAGQELRGKKLGVVGLGAIGSMVAEMGLALGMDVAGYDPAISIDAAWRLPSQVIRKENIQSLLSHADYISLHVPAIEATKHLINAEALKTMKKGAVLVNFARDAIVNAQAIVDSLNDGHLGQYVCDFPEPCLIGHEKVTAMPHIGASTEEAEDNCAVMAANQLMDYLENGNITNSVNFPQVSMSRNGCCRITFSNENVAGVLGDVLSVLADHSVNVIDMMNRSRGDMAYNIIDVEGEPPQAAIDAIAQTNSVIAVRLVKS